MSSLSKFSLSGRYERLLTQGRGSQVLLRQFGRRRRGASQLASHILDTEAGTSMRSRPKREKDRSNVIDLMDASECEGQEDHGQQEDQQPGRACPAARQGRLAFCTETVAVLGLTARVSTINGMARPPLRNACLAIYRPPSNHRPNARRWKSRTIRIVQTCWQEARQDRPAREKLMAPRGR
jgi:hypothetical protein